MIDILTAFPNEMPRFAVPICLQVYPLVLDCVRHEKVWTETEASSVLILRARRVAATVYGIESLPIEVLTTFLLVDCIHYLAMVDSMETSSWKLRWMGDLPHRMLLHKDYSDVKVPSLWLSSIIQTTKQSTLSPAWSNSLS